MEDVVDLVSSNSSSSDEASGAEQEHEVWPVAISGQAGNVVVDLTVSSEDEEEKEAGPSETPDPERIKLEVAAGAASEVDTYQQRAKKQKKMKGKNNPWPTAKSRKPHRQARRASVRDSKRIYNARTIKTRFIKAYLAKPGVREALQRYRDQLEEERRAPVSNLQQGEADEEADDEEGDHVAQTAQEADVAEIAEREDTRDDEANEGGEIVEFGGVVKWPSGVHRSVEMDIKAGVVLKDNWPADRCRCHGDCYPDICDNATANLFCAVDNCKFRGRCSNGIAELSALELFQSRTGIGVRATAAIPMGVNVAPYTGRLTDKDFDECEVQYEYVVSLMSQGRGKKKLFIDAELWGTHARFINHNCDPNTEFIELCYNREVRVVVKTLKAIEAGMELTVDYGSTWFEHNCNTPKCRQVRDQAVDSRTMDGRFWIYCRLHCTALAQDYAWARKDIDRGKRATHDETFLRSRLGKLMRQKYWQTPRDSMISDAEEDDDPRNELEILEACQRRTELEICGAPDCKILMRLHDSYTERIAKARAGMSRNEHKKA